MDSFDYIAMIDLLNVSGSLSGIIDAICGELAAHQHQANREDVRACVVLSLQNEHEAIRERMRAGLHHPADERRINLIGALLSG